jgi:hypothetical protein
MHLNNWHSLKYKTELLIAAMGIFVFCAVRNRIQCHGLKKIVLEGLIVKNNNNNNNKWLAYFFDVELCLK